MSPLATFAFIGVSVTYVNYVFTTSTRWVFLVLLVLFLLIKGRLLIGLRSSFGVALASYCAWCLATYTWSEVPYLSIAKATAFSGVAVAFVSAGFSWVRERGSLGAIYYLAPVTVLALFAGAAGDYYNGGTSVNLEFYEGLTYNPNMLGSLLAMALPVVLWSAYRFRATPQINWICIGLLAVTVVLLARTHSRSAMLAAGFIGFGFCLSLRLRKSQLVLVLIAGALFVALAAGTAILDTTYQQYVLKGVGEQNGLWMTRVDVWEKSYSGAEQGGRFGLGYGVSAGDTSFHGGLTSVGYGREKGNTQLAIVEETGLVGLGLYGCILLALFVPLIAAHRRERTTDVKVALGIIIGSLAGMTAMSIFEAWWVAPGSPESVFFWSLAGIGLSIAKSSVPGATSLGPSRIRPVQRIYSGRLLQERRAKS
jgi:O-antigen ligase